MVRRRAGGKPGGRNAAPDSQLRAAFDGAPTGIAIAHWEAATGRAPIERANPQCCRLLRGSADDIVDTDLVTLVVPEDRDALRAGLAALHDADDVHTGEYRLIHREGFEPWVQVSVRRAAGRDRAALICHLLDITDRRYLQRRVQREQQMLSGVLTSLDAGVVACNADGFVTIVNGAAANLLGDEAPERSDQVRRPPAEPDDEGDGDGECDADVVGLLARVLDGGEVEDVEVDLIGTDGVPRSLSANGRQVRSRTDEVQGAVLAIHDVTERKLAADALTQLALHDPLTELPNRILLLDRLGQALARSLRRPGEVAVLFVDLDRFKLVNDACGHEGGDEVLRTVARRIRAAIRPEDTAARLGGDEFVVVCEQIEEVDAAEHIADRITAAVEQPVPIRGSTVTIGCSVGIALATTDADADLLIRHADTAMYASKAAGRGTVTVYSDDLVSSMQERSALESELHQALIRGELEVDYQPYVSLSTRAVVGLEALVRWRHPTRGRLQPGDFLAAAESSGLMVALGRAVLTEACETAAARNAAGGRPLRIHVNVSARQLNDPGFTDHVLRTIERTGAATAAICLEFTEATLDAAGAAARRQIRALSDAGVIIALDDFGTGNASLAHLRSLPIDIVKIDRSVVEGSARRDHDASIIRAVVRLARPLGVEVAAEGVETDDQLDAVRSLGCTYAQGYLLAHPAPRHDVDHLVEIA